MAAGEGEVLPLPSACMRLFHAPAAKPARKLRHSGRFWFKANHQVVRAVRAAHGLNRSCNGKSVYIRDVLGERITGGSKHRS